MMNEDEYNDEECEGLSKHPAVAALQQLLIKIKQDPAFDEDDYRAVEATIANQGRNLEEQMQLRDKAEHRQRVLEEMVDKYDLNHYFPHLINELTEKGVRMEQTADGLMTTDCAPTRMRGK